MQKPSARAVTEYMLMPGVVPRVRELLFSGFGLIAYQIALIFSMVRILPDTHPYLVPQNAQRFGILDVFRTASANLKFSRAHIDQIIIYFTLLAAMGLLAFFFLALIALLMTSTANAAVNWGNAVGLFVTPTPKTDIAYRVLDRIFGVPGIYNSADLNPGAFHAAFHALLRYFSIMILFLAGIVLFYYTLVVVGETTLTGSPFGRRFDTVWAPIRLAVAFGLLIPLANGLNGGQYVTLYAAKFGSSLGTNLWLKYNGVATDNPLGQAQKDLVTTPKIAETDIGAYTEFLYTASACIQLYRTWHNYTMAPYLVNEKGVTTLTVATTAATFLAKLEKSNRIIFGYVDAKNTKYKNGIVPLCGEMHIPYDKSGVYVADFSQAMMAALIMTTLQNVEVTKFANSIITNYYTPNNYAVEAIPDSAIGTVVVKIYSNAINAALKGAVNAYAASKPFTMSNGVKDLGWAGAGVWYNKLAEANGPIISSQFTLPSPVQYPLVMEEVAKHNARANPQLKGPDRFNPQRGGQEPTVINTPEVTDPNLDVAITLYEAHKYWFDSGAIPLQKPSGNPFLDYISMLFGIEAIFQMRENANLHPLVALVGLGRALVEKAIRNVMLATGAATMGGLISVLDGQRFGGVLLGISGLMVTMAVLGLTAGFVLFYIIPFMPFMFLFFALGAWVRSIFEAMIGVPLWALAHMRISGPGLPAGGARQGYLIIFEIFLRPAIIISALVASLAIFAALVTTLHEVFDLLTTNIGGTQETQKGGPINWTSIESVRGPIDQFAMTLLYTALVYMIGLSCFKLIDMVPKSVLKWIGDNTQPFSTDIFNESSFIKMTGGTLGLTAQNIIGKVAGPSGMGAGLGRGIGSLMKGKGQGGNAAVGILGLTGTLGAMWAVSDRGGPLSVFKDNAGPGSFDLFMKDINAKLSGAQNEDLRKEVGRVAEALNSAPHTLDEIMENARQRLDAKDFEFLEETVDSMRRAARSGGGR